jgi:hypothetical protein
MENRCMKIKGLNKYKRRILHNEAEKLKLFHWSKQIDDQNSDLYVSNRKEHESIYKIHQKRYLKKKIKILKKRNRQWIDKFEFKRTQSIAN